MQLIDMDTLWQCETCFHHKPNGCDTWCDAGEAYRPAASKLKAIDPASLRPKGEWIGTADGYADGELVYDMWECSECCYYIDTDEPDTLPNFCPECGADMRRAGGDAPYGEGGTE